MQAVRLDLLGLGAFVQVECATGPCSDGLERCVLALPVEEVAGGDAVAVVLNLGPDHDDAVGFVVGQRGEERGVDDAEDGGVGADAESEGEDSDRGEAGVFPEEAEAEDEVAPAVAHEGSFVGRVGAAHEFLSELDDVRCGLVCCGVWDFWDVREGSTAGQVGAQQCCARTLDWVSGVSGSRRRWRGLGGRGRLL